MQDTLGRIYPALGSAWLRALSFILAVAVGGLVMWNPHSFAESIGGFNAIIGPAIIWATCTGIIHGIGFQPRAWYWQCFFFPVLAWLVQGYVLLMKFVF